MTYIILGKRRIKYGVQYAILNQDLFNLFAITLSARGTAGSTPALPGYLVRGISDDVTGNEIVRISEPVTTGLHHYSKTQPWNCNQSLMVLSKTLLDGDTFVVKLTMTGYFGSNIQWSYTDPNKFYMVTSDPVDSKFTIMTYNSTNNTITRTAPYNFLAVDSAGKVWDDPSLGGAEGNMSRDNRYCVIQGIYNAVPYSVGVFDVVLNQFVSPIISNATYGGTSLDYTTISPSGNFVMIRRKGQATGGANMLYTRNLTFIGEIPAGSHQDFGYDKEGNEIYGHVLDNFGYTILSTNPASLTNIQIAPDTQLISLIGNNVGGHTSLRHFKKPGWLGVGGWGTRNESFLVKISPISTEGVPKVIPFCAMRSTEKEANGTTGRYAAECKPCWSPDGTKMVFNTDWGVGGGTIYTIACILKQTV